MRKLTTAEFIAKAKLMHGDTYDYSKTNYVNQKTDVIIICKKHGEFKQRPNNHYVGAGCPYCSGNAKSNDMQFVDKAKAIHGDTYDYSEVEYKNNRTHVVIICKKHGRFLQTPWKHLSGQGCPKCANDKMKETNMCLYGVEYPLQSKKIHDKMESTNIDRYGVKNVGQSQIIQKRMKKTNMQKYGTEYAVASDVVKEKIKQSMLTNYGVQSPFESEIIRKKAKQKIVETYGTEHVTKLDFVRAKIVQTKRENNTFHTSKPEEQLYEMLCQHFGAHDVKRQYSSDQYPFACDFYISSRNMYVELNGLWTHDDHFFDANNPDDIAKVELWMYEAVNHPFYTSAIENWTIRDPKKQQAALSNHLNYVVFWETDLSDAKTWFQNGCPDNYL